jgi:hypothetical protein
MLVSTSAAMYHLALPLPQTYGPLEHNSLSVGLTGPGYRRAGQVLSSRD